MGIGKAQRDLEIRADLADAGGSAGDENNLSIHVLDEEGTKEEEDELEAIQGR